MSPLAWHNFHFHALVGNKETSSGKKCKDPTPHRRFRELCDAKWTKCVLKAKPVFCIVHSGCLTFIQFWRPHALHDYVGGLKSCLQDLFKKKEKRTDNLVSTDFFWIFAPTET